MHDPSLDTPMHSIYFRPLLMTSNNLTKRILINLQLNNMLLCINIHFIDEVILDNV